MPDLATQIYDPESRPYQPYGACRELFASREPEVAIVGPSGTGKTLACCNYALLTAQSQAGCRLLFCRKTRKALTESVLVTWERLAVPQGDTVLDGPHRAYRSLYTFPNKSEIVIGGLDNPDRIMSTEFDLIFCFEATELDEDDAEKLMTRLRNGAVPWQQIVFDCNPGHPGHWLKRRIDEGRCRLLVSQHGDNPTLTAEYLERLSLLTGVRRKRLFEGLWAAAEGAVWPEWDRMVHIVDRAPIEDRRRCFCSVDWGYTAPGTLQVWLEARDGCLYLVEQFYHTKKLIEWWASKAREMNAKWGASPFVCDPSLPAYIEAFQRAGLDARPADNAIEAGLSAVAARLRPGEDGRPRLFVVRDSLSERDPILAESKAPTCFQEEVEPYCWKPNPDGSLTEQPIKRDDHGCDAGRYAVRHADGGAVPMVQSLGEMSEEDRKALEAQDRRIEGVVDEWCNVENEAVWTRL